MSRYQTLGKRILALIVDSVVFLPLIVLYAWLPDFIADTVVVNLDF